eukprot:859737-Amorphochlora_amoeboformis.AAC.1
MVYGRRDEMVERRQKWKTVGRKKERYVGIVVRKQETHVKTVERKKRRKRHMWRHTAFVTHLAKKTGRESRPTKSFKMDSTRPQPVSYTYISDFHPYNTTSTSIIGI